PAPQGAGDGRAEQPDLARAEGAGAALRAGGRPQPDAGGSGARVRGDARAHPPDRSEGAAEAAAPLAKQEAARLPRVIRSRPWEFSKGPPARPSFDYGAGAIFATVDRECARSPQ